MEAKDAIALRKGTTPGPWVNKHNTVSTRPDENAVCVCVRAGTRSFQEADANARLIAAAPELLDLIEAQAAQIATLKEAFGMLEDALQEAGDDYPGSSMQQWCQQQVQAARDKIGGGND